MKKNNGVYVVDYMQMRLDSAICYVRAENFAPKKRILPTKKAYSGKVGINAEKRIKRAIEILAMNTECKVVYSRAARKKVKFWIAFIALTIPCEEIIDHREGLKALQLWLLQIKRTYSARYVWKAELQKRGQIHFHVCVDKFMEWRDIRDRWNSICRKYGWLDSYAAKKGHYNANSTDVKAISDVGHIGGYLAKYVSKDGGMIKGKVWDCSKELKGKKFYTTELISDNIVNIDLHAKRIIKLDQCTIIKCDYPTDLLSMEQAAEYVWDWKMPNE